MSKIISKITTGVFFIFNASIITKVLSIVQTIILMRILNPYDFGIVAISMSFILIIQRFQTIGFSEAIIAGSGVKVEDDELSTLFGLRLGISSLLYLVAFLFAPLWSYIYNDFEITNVVRFSAILFLIRSFGVVPLTLLKINTNFKILANVNVIDKLSSTIIIIALAYSGFSYWSILIGKISGGIISVIYLNIIQPWHIRIKFNKDISRKLFSFGKWLLFSSIVFTLVSTIDTIIIGKELSLIELGFYSIAIRWGYLTLLNLTPTLQKVLFPILSLNKDSNEVRASYLYAIYFVSLISFPITFGIISVAPEFINLIGGEKWKSVIILLQILSICGLIRSLNLVDPVYASQEKPKYSFYIVLFMLIYFSVFLYPAIRLYGLIGASICITFGYFLNFIYSVSLLKKVIEIKVMEIFHKMLLPLFSSCMMCFVILFSKDSLAILIDSQIAILVLLVLFGVILYCIFMVVLSKGKIINEIHSFIEK